MLVLPTQAVVDCRGRVPLAGWSCHDDVWLVDATVATCAERAQALSSGGAVEWARAVALNAPTGLTRRLEERRILLVVRPLELPVLATTPAVVDLRDLTEEALQAPDIGQGEDEADVGPHFIDVLVVDAHGQPRASVLYELVLPDDSVHTGRTTADGRVRIEGLTQVGDARLTFPELESE